VELFLLYVWLQLPSIFILLVIIGAVMAFWGIGCALYACGPDVKIYDEKVRCPIWLPRARRRLTIALCIWTGALLMPSKTDVAILVGGHFALKMADSPEAAKITSILRLKANEILDKQLSKENR
jgi:hypothetical protein